MIIRFPYLIFNIILEQHKDILPPTEVVVPHLCISHIHAKLFEGHHILDMDSTKKKGNEYIFDMSTLRSG